jgi:hypothetical protein
MNVLCGHSSPFKGNTMFKAEGLYKKNPEWQPRPKSFHEKAG